MNNGFSSRLIYDECAYQDRTKERTDPLLYKLSTHQIHNCDQCMSTLGPRSGFMGQGVSTTAGHPVATAQFLTDVESILTNRNLPQNKCKGGEVNPINVLKFGLKHLNNCGSYLDPMASRLTYPPYNIRETTANRFYDLNHNPQEPIYWDFATNTKLEAKDNYIYDLDTLKSDASSRPTETFVGSDMGNCSTSSCGRTTYAIRPPYQ